MSCDRKELIDDNGTLLNCLSEVSFGEDAQEVRTILALPKSGELAQARFPAKGKLAVARQLANLLESNTKISVNARGMIELED